MEVPLTQNTVSYPTSPQEAADHLKRLESRMPNHWVARCSSSGERLTYSRLKWWHTPAAGKPKVQVSRARAGELFLSIPR